MSRTSDNGIVEGLGRMVMLWDPLDDVHYVKIEDVRRILAERQFCWVHESPELTEEEQAFADADDIDAVCIQVVRVG